MSQRFFATETLPSLVSLDANFTETYKPLAAMTFDGSNNLTVVTLQSPAFFPRASFLKSGIGAYYVGGDGVGTVNDFIIYYNAQKLLRIDNSTAAVTPGSDNVQNLGAPSYRWSTVYAAVGSINTSDARTKTAVAPLRESEINAAKQLAAEIGSFKFLDAVKAKGDGARAHIGMTVQRAIEILKSNALDPMSYGFICHDAWPADGAAPAGDLYGFRTDELLLFIARGFDARLSALEAR